MSEHLNPNKGIIAWFARNSVAANLLMISLVIAGLYASLTVRKQIFPEVENNYINVSVVYRGASPQEVEEAITIKLEEALESVQGLKKIITRSSRGYASASLEVLDGYDPRTVMDDVQTSIDSITSFPAGMERPIVRNTPYRQDVMYISLAGDMQPRELKSLGERIFDEIRALPGVNIAEYYSGKNYEIAIEVSPDKLREYDLTFANVASAVRNFSTNRSAGEIRADQGVISVRVEEQAYTGPEFEQVVVKTLPNGEKVRVRDIARVNDGFEEGIQYTKLDGVDAVTFYVGASRDQSITDVAETLYDYLETKQASLPEGVRLEPWVDITYYLKGRLNMMLSNIIWGGLLVFMILALFLRMKLAFWVMLGLPISFLGAMAFLPTSMIDVTINIVSLFGFILVLGVVVDDAIIIGESVSTEVESKGQSIDNVIRGAKRVATPATFGVLTTMAAFMPMVMQSGPNSAVANAIGLVVVLCLIFSLVESKLILPAHLATMKPEKPDNNGRLTRIRRGVDAGLYRFIENVYTPFLERMIRFRYSVLTFFIAILIVMAGLQASGVLKMIPFPKVPHDFVTINMEMNADVSEEATLDAALAINQLIETVGQEINDQYGNRLVDKTLIDLRGRTNAIITAKLVEPHLRPISSIDVANIWRERMPEIAGLKTLNIQDTLGGGGGAGGGDISFIVESKNENQLKSASEEVKRVLSAFEGVSQVNDSEPVPVTEARFELKPLAYSLGLTTGDVAAQASYSLYGVEAQRIVRDRQEIRVMVRYPEEHRNSLDSLNEVMIRTPEGAQVPLDQIADVILADSKSQIYRENGNRAITISAAVDFDKTQPFLVADELERDVFPSLRQQFPRVNIEEAGKLKDDRENQAEQLLGIVMILLPIYLLLALPLRSYFQPLMIMSVIPFGIVGAVVGHLIHGLDISFTSIFGIYAVIGVVVNDSLVMVDFVNKSRAEGTPIREAVVLAGRRRFRAILLTSLTTFFGLIPIMMETSLQAQIVIPMAVSLAYGVLLATGVTLILVPTLYVITEDLSAGLKKLFGLVGRRAGRNTHKSATDFSG